MRDVEEDLGDCRNVSVNVGIVRRMGVDISDFIQTLLADKTGSGVKTEKKDKCTVYIDPKHSNVNIWDLPTIGNPVEYLKAIQVDKFDLFLILCETVFGDIEMLFADKCVERKKGLFFVRTNIDEIVDALGSENFSELRSSLFKTIDIRLSTYPQFVIVNHKVFSADIAKLKLKFHQAIISLKRLSRLSCEPNYLEKYLQSVCEEWRDAKVNIAVVGESGTGKSSFVNAARNLKASDTGAARVGVAETTTQPDPYPFPNNENVIFWDLPGVGTRIFSGKNYLQAVEFDKYDCFIIMSSMRFTEHDEWLSKEAQNRKKSYFFVRTKFDEAIKDKKYEEVREKIKKNIQKNITIEDRRIYMISNPDRDLYDFPRLLEDVIGEMPSLKKQSLLLTLTAHSEKIIEMKREALKPRLWKKAMLSGVVATVPVPGVDALADLGILLQEAKFYRDTFGLSDRSLRQLAEQYNIGVERLERAMPKTGAMTLTKAGMRAALTASRIGLTFATKTTVTPVLEIVLPVTGSLISGSMSIVMMYGFLKMLLNDYATDAASVYALCAQKTADNASKST